MSRNDDLDRLTAPVHQAAGMVSAQLACRVEEALGRLRIRAKASGKTLEELAADVFERRIRFAS
jgi:hypothetical protein